MDIVKAYSLDSSDQIVIVFEETGIYVYDREANICFPYSHLVQINTYKGVNNPTLLTLRVYDNNWRLEMYVYPKDITGNALKGHITWSKITPYPNALRLGNYYRINTTRQELETIILKYYPGEEEF